MGSIPEGGGSRKVNLTVTAGMQIAAGKGGEDAFFVSDTLWGAIGVADGVGGWNEDGVDPALFSR